MIPVKLRAYNPITNKLWGPVNLINLFNNFIYQSKPVSYAYLDIKDHFKDIIWSQYIGFSDEKEEELYLGDIVEVSDWDWEEGKSEIGVIRYDCGSHYIQTDAMSMYRLMDYKIKKLGNIYKNSDLLPFKLGD